MGKELIKTLIGAYSSHGDTLTDKDEVYNRVARNQPAYISLLFPMIAAIIIANDYKLFTFYGNVFEYIFNCSALLILFLPAVFYLYKQMIRVISELIVEVIIFWVWDPNYAPYNSAFCFALTPEESRKVKNRLLNKYKVRLDILNEDRKEREQEVKKAIKYIREDEKVRENNIVFENNCVYGFFRNLVGGIALNLLIIYSLKIFKIDIECLNMFLHYAIRILWILFIVFIVMAWYSRFRHMKRQSIVFFVMANPEECSTIQAETDSVPHSQDSQPGAPQ